MPLKTSTMLGVFVDQETAFERTEETGGERRPRATLNKQPGIGRLFWGLFDSRVKNVTLEKGHATVGERTRATQPPCNF